MRSMSIFKLPKLSWFFCCNIKVLFITLGMFASHYAVTKAQIVPDRTLPNNSTITTDGSAIEINGGTVRGTNLFHSFTEFSLDPENLGKRINSAYFNNAPNVANIFSRVTGNSISKIDGLIRNNGDANLFLINPNGIIFGKNAALNLGGSFVASTADSIQFADNLEFSAVNPQANPLLSVNIPVGLQYGNLSGDITVYGNNKASSSGLEVLADKTLALIGANVFIEGANLTAPAGNIELGSVDGDRTIGLNPSDLGWKADYTEVKDFGRISLSKAASIDASGNSGGRIWVQGESVSLTEGSAIATNILGDGTTGLLSIAATDLEISGYSSLSASVEQNAPGNGSNIVINSDSLTVNDGGLVYLQTDGIGDGGSLTIDSDRITLEGIDSGLFSTVAENARGNGANIELYTERLAIEDAARIASDTIGLGNGGNLTIDARQVDLIDDSGIYAHAITDAGNGGDIAIATDTLLIENGAEIYAGNFSQMVEKSDPNLLHTLQVSSNSLAYSIIGTGEVGKIELNANSIVMNGTDEKIGRISTSTYQAGGGTIGLNSNTISISNSEIFTNTKGDSHGGSIYLNADNLYLSQGKISTNTFATGNGGKIIVETTNSSIANGLNSGIFARGDINASGNAGKIGVVANLVEFKNGSQIDATNFGLGEDGEISIEADRIYLERDRVISSLKENSATLKNINVARSGINNQSLDLSELLQKTNAPAELTISNCTPQRDRNIRIGQNLGEAVASQKLPQIFPHQAHFNNVVVEAKSWIVNSQGKIELLANSCQG